jgi:hypothetical protein
MLKRWICVATLAAFLAITPSWAAGTVADAADQVQPLLIGATVPALELQSGEGESFDLGAAFAKQPTIVVFYRGGW